MKKIFNVVFALLLFSTTANAAGLESPAWSKNFQFGILTPSDPSTKIKNLENSGTDYRTSLEDGVQMLLNNSGELNLPAGQHFQLKADELSEASGQTVTADDVRDMYKNHEYHITTFGEYENEYHERPTNFAVYVDDAQLAEDSDPKHYDSERRLLVLDPVMLPGYHSASLKDWCINHQKGTVYVPTGDNDADYSLPPAQESEGLTLDVDMDNSNENDIDINVPASETNEYGVYIENYYAGETAGGSGMTQSYPYYDDQLYWSLGASWSQCGGWSFNGGLSNSPYGVGGGSGYGYNSGYNSGFGQYCGENGFGGTYNTINNYYYGDVNPHNNNNINSGNTTFNWQQWVNNHQNGDDDDPPVVDNDDDLPTNTGGIEGQATGDNLPGNNAGTTTGKQKQPSGFKKDYKKSQQKGDEVYYANADETKKDQGTKTGSQSKSDNMDGAKAKNDAKAKNEGQSKVKPEFNASADKNQVENQGDERNFEMKSEQVKTQPAEKQFEIKEKPVKQNNTASKPKVEQKKTNVDENYDKPTKEYQKKNSPEVKKSAPVKKSPEVKKQPVKKSTTVKGSGAKVKPNPSAKKSTGTKYQKPTSRKSAGSGQNYRNGNNGNRQNGNQNSKTRNSGSSPSPKRGGRS